MTGWKELLRIKFSAAKLPNTLMSNLEAQSIQDAIDDYVGGIKLFYHQKSISLSSGNDWLWKKH
mgnify:CR=1 FL=1